MSGGVDSSVAAALMARRGHDVVGCTLKLWGGPSDSGCCSVADVEDARRVAQVLGLDHHVFNMAEEFEAGVVGPYVAAHARGSTPNPCIECNRTVKFDALTRRAARLGFDAVATGHHARVVQGPCGFELRRGADRAKDQSYVLGFLGSVALARVLLPIGEMPKSRVRAIAGELGLRTADKPDSQEVCFIPRGGRASFLEGRTELTGATVIDLESGEELGTVPAAQLVTVGQRRGVARGIDGTPRFVSRVDVGAGRVYVGRRDAVLIDRLDLVDGSWTWARTPKAVGDRVLVQASAHGTATPATIRTGPRGRALVLDLPTRPVAAGQTAVLYEPDDPDLVVGTAIVAQHAAA
jgi:tRNA-specific 2-thiouridylase